MDYMTTRSLSFSSLRALASARRHDLSGNWSNIADRDLSRAASDLLAVSYDDGSWAQNLPKRTASVAAPVPPVAEPVAAPVDLEARRSAKSATPAPSPATSHARAS
jgi:hypothetical protein